MQHRFIRRQLALAAGALCLALALAPGLARAQAAIADLRAAASTIILLTAAGDIDGLAALYAPDAILFLSDGTTAAGRDAIRAVYERNRAAGTNRIAFNQVSYDGGADRGVTVWAWTLTIEPAGGGDAVATSGRSLVYWKRYPAGWLIVADMFQAARAPSTPAR